MAQCASPLVATVCGACQTQTILFSFFSTLGLFSLRGPCDPLYVAAILLVYTVGRRRRCTSSARCSFSSTLLQHWLTTVGHPGHAFSLISIKPSLSIWYTSPTLSLSSLSVFSSLASSLFFILRRRRPFSLLLLLPLLILLLLLPLLCLERELRCWGKSIVPLSSVPMLPVLYHAQCGYRCCHRCCASLQLHTSSLCPDLITISIIANDCEFNSTHTHLCIKRKAESPIHIHTYIYIYMY